MAKSICADMSNGLIEKKSESVTPKHNSNNSNTRLHFFSFILSSFFYSQSHFNGVLYFNDSFDESTLSLFYQTDRYIQCYAKTAISTTTTMKPW